MPCEGGIPSNACDIDPSRRLDTQWGHSMSCLPSPECSNNVRKPGPSCFRDVSIGVKSKLYRNGPGALQNHISTHLRQGLSPLARRDVADGRYGIHGGRGSGAMGNMTCLSHSEVVEVVGALDVFRGVKETNSHMVPMIRHRTTLTHRRRA